MSLVNVAVWGLGNHAINRILPILSSSNQLNLIGVCSRDSEKVAKISQSLNCCGWKRPKDMLNNLKVDVVYIATPIGLHYNMAKLALESGKHVWCEKPLTCNYKDSLKLVSIARKNKKVITESFMYLYHPQFKRLKQFVKESNKINSIVCRFGIPELSSPGFRNDPNLCGGALWDVSCYTTSALLALFPEEEVSVIFSEVLRNNDSLVDNSGRAILRFSGGATAYIEWAVGVAYKNEFDLWSSEGSIFTDKIFSKPSNYVPSFYLRDINGKKSVEKGEACDQFSEMFSDFLLMFQDKEKIENEKKVILRRAELLNNIVMYHEKD